MIDEPRPTPAPLEIEGEHLEAADGVPALIPAGRYTVQSQTVTIEERFKRRMVRLVCEVVDPPAYDGTRLCWFAPVPPGRARPAWTSKFCMAWLLAAGRRPARGEHLGVRMLVGKRYLAVVTTVTEGWQRDERRRPVPLPPAGHYSKIATLLERA